jgi:hypothetical protein
MGGKYRQLDHLNALSDGGAPQEFVQERARRHVDHWSAINGAP